jgi:hypothetical protein
MFKTALMGPIGGFGVARQCVECRWVNHQRGATRCFGFGPGCLGAKPLAFTPDVPGSLEKIRLNSDKY